MSGRFFPMPHLKQQGAPCHPDDTGHVYGSDGWKRQLAAYVEHYRKTGMLSDEEIAALTPPE